MAANDVSALNGLFKKQYADHIDELIPQIAILQKLVDWVPADKMLGDLYAVPTLLRSNQGVTYVGEGGSVVTLKSAKAAVMKEAQIKGSEINIRGQLSYKTLSAASAAGPKAFKKASAWLVEDLTNVAYTRIEIAALWGRSGLGTVSGTPTIVGSPPSGASANTYNVVITDSEFAPGLWAPLEGATLEFFNGTTNRTVVGTIVQVTTATSTVMVDFTTAPGGNLTQSGDGIYFEGANAGSGSFNEMSGLYDQLSATSGVKFNIDRGVYTLMQGNVKSGVGAISKAKIIDAAMLAVDKGCLKNLVCLVGTKAWGYLNAEDMALRMFDESYDPTKSESGSKELIYDSVNGQIKVVCHPMMKKGYAILFDPDDVCFVGSAKPTFEIPGMSEQFFRIVQDQNAVELQNYADLAIYHEKPGRAVVMTGITYP